MHFAKVKLLKPGVIAFQRHFEDVESPGMVLRYREHFLLINVHHAGLT